MFGPIFRRVVMGLRTMGALLLLLLAGAVVATIPAMQAVDRFVARHQAVFFGAAVVMLALGFGLFFGGLIAMTVKKGRWMSGKELNEYYRGMSQPALGVHRKVAGGAPVFAARDAFTLADLKEAWRQNTIWRPPARNRAVRALGLALAFLGFCLFQFSLTTTAAKGYALVLFTAGVTWLMTKLLRAQEL